MTGFVYFSHIIFRLDKFSYKRSLRLDQVQLLVQNCCHFPLFSWGRCSNGYNLDIRVSIFVKDNKCRSFLYILSVWMFVKKIRNIIIVTTKLVCIFWCSFQTRAQQHTSLPALCKKFSNRQYLHQWFFPPSIYQFIKSFECESFIISQKQKSHFIFSNWI